MGVLFLALAILLFNKEMALSVMVVDRINVYKM
jgi:hypothetical protein